ncbi:DUF7557 family protein [Desulfonatronum parangueonense]
MKEAWSVKLDPDFKSRLSALASEHESGEEFVMSLVTAYEQTKYSNVKAPSHARPLVGEIVRAFQSIIEQISASISVAEREREQAGKEIEEVKEAAKTQIQTANQVVTDLKTRLEASTKSVIDGQKRIQELEEALKTAQDKTESIEALKLAWMEKETSLIARIAELDEEAKQARELDKKVVSLEKMLAATKDEAGTEITKLKHATELRQQQIALEHEKEIAKLKEDLSEVRHAAELSEKQIVLEREKEIVELKEQLSETRHAAELAAKEAALAHSAAMQNAVDQVRIDAEAKVQKLQERFDMLAEKFATKPERKEHQPSKRLPLNNLKQHGRRIKKRNPADH